MEPITADQLRASLVNCTKGEAKRMWLPPLTGVDWDNLDFFGWREPGVAPGGGMVLWRGGEPLAIALRSTPRPPSNKQGMCSLCLTFHSASEIGFMGAKRAGSKGREGNTVAAAMCDDLACSLYARKLKQPRRVQPQETTDIEGRVQRLQINLHAFVARVVDGR